MADRGLVKKEKCDSDRRGAYVVLTRRGHRQIEAAAPGHVDAVRRLLVDRLTLAQIDAIGEAADIVLAAFDEPVEPEVAGVLNSSCEVSRPTMRGHL